MKNFCPGIIPQLCQSRFSFSWYTAEEITMTGIVYSGCMYHYIAMNNCQVIKYQSVERVLEGVSLCIGTINPQIPFPCCKGKFQYCIFLCRGEGEDSPDKEVGAMVPYTPEVWLVPDPDAIYLLNVRSMKNPFGAFWKIWSPEWIRIRISGRLSWLIFLRNLAEGASSGPLNEVSNPIL